MFIRIIYDIHSVGGGTSDRLLINTVQYTVPVQPQHRPQTFRQVDDYVTFALVSIILFLGYFSDFFSKYRKTEPFASSKPTNV